MSSCTGVQARPGTPVLTSILLSQWRLCLTPASTDMTERKCHVSDAALLICCVPGIRLSSRMQTWHANCWCVDAPASSRDMQIACQP